MSFTRVRLACVVLSVLLVAALIFAGLAQYRYQKYYNLCWVVLDQNLELLDQNIGLAEAALYWKAQFETTGANATKVVLYLVRDPSADVRWPGNWSYEVPVSGGSYVVIPDVGVYRKMTAEELGAK